MGSGEPTQVSMESTQKTLESKAKESRDSECNTTHKTASLQTTVTMYCVYAWEPLRLLNCVYMFSIANGLCVRFIAAPSFKQGGYF